MFKKISVIGLGLLGGSFCKVVKETFPDVEIHAFGRDLKKLEPAINESIVDYIGTLSNISLRGIELIVVAVPVIATIDIINNLLDDPELDEDALIIDMGSVKDAIVRGVIDNENAGRFIGCHPMAGSEKTGYSFSKSCLFENESVIITPNKKNRKIDIEKIQQFWEMLKAKPIIISPDLHDKIITYTSHFPHLVACLIVELLKKNIQNDLSDNLNYFIGNGFLDLTRISSASPDMWHDITILNKNNLIDSIDELIKNLENFKTVMKDDNLKSNGLYDFFENTREFRDSLA